MNSNRGRKPTLTIEIELKIAEMYNSGEYTINKLAQYFKVSNFPIHQAIKKNKCKVRSQSELQRKYPIVEDFFDKIDTEEKAYILGFLYADGCNHVEIRAITLGLKESDVEILNTITNLIQPTKPLQYINKKKENPNNENQYRFVMCSEHMSQRLIELGCGKAKTHNLSFPTEDQVPKNLQNHFIRGYFDGDGCVLKPPYKYFTIVGNGLFLSTLQNILMEELKFNKTKLVKNKKESGNDIKVLVYGGIFQCIKFRDWIYEDSTIYLKRKKEIFDTYRVTTKIKNIKSDEFDAE